MQPNPLHRHPRVLFASWHCYLDLSSGAALATRDLLELLAARGWDCRVLCGPLLDYDAPPSTEALLQIQGLPFQQQPVHVNGAPFQVFQLTRHGVPVTLFDLAGPARRRMPMPVDGTLFLSLFEDILRRFQPDLLWTYGGDPLTQEAMARARRRGLGVIFALHNFGYHDLSSFREADAVWVPSQFSRRHHRQRLGLECTALPYSWDWSRIRCPRAVEGTYVTYVNPQWEKGVCVFARIAQELNRQRPEIPLLVVESRGGVNWFSPTGLDLRGLDNLHKMSSTPDPRQFYQVSRLVLMPSLWWESFGRVAAEAMINGIPVLASNRGALPEILFGSGFLFDIPPWYSPETRLIPLPEEVAPWVETILQLWDDPVLYEYARHRSFEAAEYWRPERVLPLYEEFLHRVWQQCRERHRTAGTA
jgi:glycosyltransferase involved in cell wall biosynthesis